MFSCFLDERANGEKHCVGSLAFGECELEGSPKIRRKRTCVRAKTPGKTKTTLKNSLQRYSMFAPFNLGDSSSPNPPPAN